MMLATESKNMLENIEIVISSTVEAYDVAMEEMK
jgi:hypothetical protein